MRKYLLIVFTCIYSLSFAQFSAQDSIVVDSIMSDAYPNNQPGAIILIAKDGKEVFSKAYGMASLELDVPLDTDHVLAIGSMSKQFTAVAILQLAEEGKLSLDDPITKYLTEYNTHGETITIRHILTHTSGITSFTELDTFPKIMNIDMGKQEMNNLFMHEDLLFEPGSNFSYSNSGYSLAGLIVEEVSGMSLQAYVKLKILRPLGMRKTNFGSNDISIPGLAPGYTANNTGFYPAREFSWTWPFAAGGIVSTVGDLLKWDKALYTNKVLDDEYMKEAFTAQPLENGQSTNYGLGWGVSSFNGIEMIRHGGAINGYLSDAIRIPSEKYYIVILSNNTIRGPGGYLDQIVNYLLGFNIEETEVLEYPDNVEEYTGVYEEERRGGRIASNMSESKLYRYITFEDSILYTQKKGGSKIQLNCIGEDEFITTNPYTRFYFRRDDSGKVNAIERIFLPTHFGPKDYSPKTTLQLPGEKESIELSNEIINRYIGNYDLGSGLTLNIELDGGRIFARIIGQPRVEIFAASETDFFYKAIDAEIEFIVEDEKCTGLIFNQGSLLKGKKIE